MRAQECPREFIPSAGPRVDSFSFHLQAGLCSVSCELSLALGAKKLVWKTRKCMNNCKVMLSNLYTESSVSESRRTIRAVGVYRLDKCFDIKDELAYTKRRNLFMY